MVPILSFLQRGSGIEADNDKHRRKRLRTLILLLDLSYILDTSFELGLCLLKLSEGVCQMIYFLKKSRRMSVVLKEIKETDLLELLPYIRQLRNVEVSNVDLLRLRGRHRSESSSISTVLFHTVKIIIWPC
jgi:hypothetical protein